MSMVNIALVGIGYWGPNLLRTFVSLPQVKVCVVCDKNKSAIDKYKSIYPNIRFITDFKSVVEDKNINAVVISTPAITHYEIAMLTLLSGKDVFVEKPVALKVKHAEELIRIAQNNKRILMVGHLLEYHPAVLKLKGLIEGKTLGDIYYLESRRLNLGKIRREENVIWSLATHDIATMIFLLGKMPVSVDATGNSYIQKQIEDLAFLTLRFPGNILGHVSVNWLSPRKIREITVVGSHKMAIFDDMVSEEKLKIWNQYKEEERFVSYQTLPKLKFGSISIPKVKLEEPLKIECEHFIECVKSRKQPRSSGEDGLRVLKVLKAAQDSLRKRKVIKIV
ncbi:MAG: Gfo/Idh/MocA family oxidoreductase [Candidatus Omnitrophica bacterium]|jgi:UDP-2-acetamido-3-amino-2,3-dideoxy-glucuronate N-acetyltransferase|nr:Gfo/Idh/MocA family oxidoreductase [Candidatus Omnitrophota bacterium]